MSNAIPTGSGCSNDPSGSRAARQRFVLGRAASFWVSAGVVGHTLWTSAAPAMTYPLYAAQWHLSHDQQQATIEFRPRLVCNDLELLRRSVLSGLGIAALPAFICKRDLAEGRMVEVLPGWRPPEQAFFAVFPQQQAMPVRVRSFIDFLVERLRPTLSWNSL